MLSAKTREALNKHLNAEVYSSYLYLSMSAYFEALNLRGFGNWMRVQAQEEMVHAMKFYKWLVDQGARVLLQPLEGPPTEWKSPLEAFKAALKHEQLITSKIHDLANKAVAEKDHATNVFLHWFVSEQVEEEATANEIVEKLKMIKDSGGGLLMLDHQMEKRTFSPPASE